MSEEFKIGDKLVVNEHRVITVTGFTYGHLAVPNGWPLDEDGSAVNPKFCRKYSGALSALKPN